MASLTPRDADLILDVSNFLKEHYSKERHHVACLLACGDRLYYALHLDSKGFDVCAEPVALSNALLAQEKNFDTIVAVSWD
jgi:cytidine deaminase